MHRGHKDRHKDRQSVCQDLKLSQSIIQYISYKSYGRVCDLANKNWDLVLCVLDDKDEWTINNNVLLLSKCCREECNLDACGGGSFCSLFCHLGKMRLGEARANGKPQPRTCV